MKQNLIDFLEFLKKNPVKQEDLLKTYNSRYGRFDYSMSEEFSFLFSDLWINLEDSPKFIEFRIEALLSSLMKINGSFNHTLLWFKFKNDCDNKTIVQPHSNFYSGFCKF